MSPASPASPGFPSFDLPGWAAHRAAQFVRWQAQGLVPARVVRADRDRWLVLGPGDAHPVAAVVRGRLRHEASSAEDLPAVGDWVALAPAQGAGSPAVIHAVLPRDSSFRRQAAGDETVAQVIAANIDVVFLVAGLDGDFNLRRIERYVAAVWESGALPVIVLNKADLAGGGDVLSARIAEVEAVALGVPVVALSARDGAGLDALAPHLVAGRTIALVGSSGVGKSTLVNALLGADRQRTQAVREDDQRGRHTTTHREIVPLPGGVLLLDTPGMREFALWGAGEAAGGAQGDGVQATFADVEAFAAGCRFGDCRHDGEPGCAVRQALADGTLDPARHASWVKLRRELRAFEIRHDARLAREERARWKTVSKTVRKHMKQKYGQ